MPLLLSPVSSAAPAYKVLLCPSASPSVYPTLSSLTGHNPTH